MTMTWARLKGLESFDPVLIVCLFGAPSTPTTDAMNAEATLNNARGVLLVAMAGERCQ